MIINKNGKRYKINSKINFSKDKDKPWVLSSKKIFKKNKLSPKEERKVNYGKKIKALTDGKTVVKVIVVPGKLVNIVVK